MTRVQSIVAEATALGEAAKGIVSILTSGKLGTVGGAGQTPLTLQTIGATVQILYSDEDGDTQKNMPSVMVFEKGEKTYFRQGHVPIIGLYPGAVILSKTYGAPLQLVPLNLPVDAPLMRAIYLEYIDGYEAFDVEHPMLHPHRYKTGQFFASKDEKNQAVLDPRSGVNSTCFLGELLELFTSVDFAVFGLTWYDNDDEDSDVPSVNELWEDDYLLTKLQTLVCAFVIKRLGYGRMLKHHVPTPDFDVIGALESVGNQGKVLINGRTVAGRDNGYVDTLVSFLFEFIEVMRAKELYRREIIALREKHPLTTPPIA